jgi:excinuclease ABC subunit A
MRPDTVQSVTDAVLALPEGTRFYVTYPLILSPEVTHEVAVDNLRAQGFLRVVVDGAIKHLDDLQPPNGATLRPEVRGAEGRSDDKPIDITFAKQLLVVVDRLAVGDDARGRLPEAVGTAFREGDGDCVILFTEPVTLPGIVEKPSLTVRFTERYECATDGTRAPSPTPQLFSFNSPRGACKRCNGFGATLEYDESLIIPYPARSLREGAIAPWTMPRYENKRRALAEFAKKEGISMDTPWEKLPRTAREKLLRGKAKGFKGIFPFLVDLEEKRYKQYIRVFLRQYQTAQECPDCHGTKLQPEALQVRIAGRTVADVAAELADATVHWLDGAVGRRT